MGSVGNYPFYGDKCFVENRWYVAAFSHEITRGPFERSVLGQPVVLYRSTKGDPVAMYGLCPHRYYPLAKGRLEGDALKCGYHGFAFDARGKCTNIPSQNTGTGFHQRIYPTYERGGWVWIWMGDADKADQALLPPYEDFGLDQSGWTTCGDTYFLANARAQLLIDNLMDLTHVAFIHGQLSGDALVDAKIETEERVRSYCVRRKTRMSWTGFHDLLFGPDRRFAGMSEIESRTDFYGPELTRTSGPVTLSVDGLDEVPSGIGEVYFLHATTPATKSSTHYFGLITRNIRLDDDHLDHALKEMEIEVRQQDVDAIEAIEERLEWVVERSPELLARSDRAATEVRSRIQVMLDNEVPPHS